MNRVDGHRCTREQLHEAAVWMTLLRGPDRSARMERGFRRWLAAHPDHEFAFETTSDAWESADVLPRGPLPHLSRWQREGFRTGFRHAFAGVAALAVLAIVSLFAYQRYIGETTDIGEQRILTLQDGTRVYMNTDTRVVVDYDRRQRTVALKRGEAYFDVAQRGATWPFSVTVGGRRVNAVGTSFVVRRDTGCTTVTLVDGKVTVLPARSAPLIALSPGDRLTFQADRTPARDRPSMDRILAWRSGHVDLGDLSLAQAAAEMNRYSPVKITVAAEVADTAMFGVFRAGDTESFANAVADTWGLKVRHEPRRIVIEE